MSYRERLSAVMGSRGSKPDGERLHELFAAAWDHMMEDSPESATFFGVTGHDDRWTDLSPGAVERRRQEAPLALDAVRTIDRHALGETDRVSWDLFEYNARLDVEAARFPSELRPLSQVDGVHQDAALVLGAMKTDRAEDYERLVERVRNLPEHVAQVVDLMRRGLREGITPPRITLRDVPEQVRNQMVGDPAASPLLAPLQSMPAGIPAAQQERIRRDAAAAHDQAVPAFGALHDFLVDEYLPGARESIAASDLPDGADWYQHDVRRYTTTEMTPDEIHDLGQSEVARIRAEMDEVIGRTGFSGTFTEFTDHLRTDDRFYLGSADELLARYRDIAKRIDPELCRLFGRLPRLPYGVIPVPAYAERSQPTAYYLPGSTDSNRPGWFFANTYDLRSRPTWEMEALTLHEAVPGHHLQLAIAEELEGIPDFRRLWSSYTAYVEGWGLYAESLGDELGCYRDPHDKFGQLVYEMWRAIRLVVDTGMHALGWSREQAIDFFRQHTGKADHDIVVEVDRYIVWPGQALAYKLGELKIKELRAHATATLGEAFDIRAFHDTVLGQGALPLDVLDAQVRSWVAAGGGR